MIGCYLFFLAFFFAGMFSASCVGVAWICRGRPRIVADKADTPICSSMRPVCQEKSANFICSGKNPNRSLRPEAAGGLVLSFS
jgi:hypothetical protein